MKTVPEITDDILGSITFGLPLSDVMDALNNVMAATIIHAANGDSFEEMKLLHTVKSDLSEKLHGVVN